MGLFRNLSEIFLLNMIGVFICCIRVISASVEEPDYCSLSKALCPEGVKHIACDNNRYYAPQCGTAPDFKPFTNDEKNTIVHLQNLHRNEVASGKLSLFGYQPATRMATLQWNDELATMAEYNAKSCEGEPDMCHNTCEFPYSGQLVKQYSYEWEKDYPQNFIEALEAVARQYYRNPSPPDFNVMITDHYTHVGCARIMILTGNGPKSHLICNYGSSQKKPGRYDEGDSASECNEGANDLYEYLCSPNESYGEDGENVC